MRARNYQAVGGPRDGLTSATNVGQLGDEFIIGEVQVFEHGVQVNMTDTATGQVTARGGCRTYETYFERGGTHDS